MDTDAEKVTHSADYVALEKAYRELAEAVAGPPGSTCILAENMADTEWLRRQWRNAIEQWSWWHKEAEYLGGEQPISLTIRAKNWESRARHAEALLRQHGIDPHLAAVLKEATDG